ncbi:hypothetical protein WJX81_007539 [Elliptochloris bilobata]|uniref:Tyr recombinase domain-containing protein n=1 Tax=Elliptochloris bilobata TaxID=381761 RepID=A0AAW1SE05_9CHLO
MPFMPGGREPDKEVAALVERLHENWFSTAGQLATVSEVDAKSLRVPLRLLAELRGLLEDDAEAPAEDGPGCPISKGRMPLLGRMGHRDGRSVLLTKRERTRAPFAIRDDAMGPELRAELDAFRRFCTVRFFGAQSPPILPITAEKYCDHLRRALGWLHQERGVPVEELSLSKLFPSAERAGVAVAFDYMQWLNARGISPSTEGIAVRSLMQAAKFMYHEQSQARPDEGEKAYGDLLVVRELRKLSNEARRATKIAARTADESLKWLEWPQFLMVVNELRSECAARDSIGRKRTGAAVAWSIQRYLILALLSCIPDRQRTVRELVLGRTLVKEDGRWLIRHGAGDYKTGRSYGERPPLVVAEGIYPWLEAFLDRWRTELKPTHAFVFTARSGAPLTAQAVHRLFVSTCYRLTGKKTNPHLVRDMIVTHLRSTGASERELEALAIYMGHSLAMQRGCYDRRTKAAKVLPAVDLLAAINQQAMHAP